MNTPSAIRDESHAAKRAAHADHRDKVFAALVAAAAPISTRALAQAMKWDVLSVRPRVTELFQMGLIVLDGRCEDGGLYRVATASEIQAHQRRVCPRGGEVQTELPFTARRGRR